ncbi:MAG TPA: MdtA/MuxA family multidrug efflux RND transporter periplasmic adaptor subunit [Candidatus Saccharimonadales bacterium]|jgi:multidrug efflux system membrane fusion protein|nr:MdtA/MuxA family multidrug efflux RND transporter periplasmic adaptor subunit [Candidatus Saccharimonadales bacterium]
MGHLKSIDLPEPGARDTSAAPPAKSRWWLWIAILAVVAIGIWYYRGARATSEAGGKAAPGATSAGKGRGGPGGAGMTVPVVIATAQKGNLPVYLIGLGSATAYNTVTVRSRVDGQIVKVNFTEGQFVHAGDALIEIDPRPYQVQLEQAEGQLAKDQAQLHDVQVDFERYQLLYSEGVIPKQQVDTQQAQVGQFQGAIKADQATIDSAKLQLVYAHITAPISGRVGLRLVDIGNIVHAADTTGLLVITQLQPISVIFTLPQDQLQQVLVKLRGGGQLPVEAYDRDDLTKITDGKLATIDNQIDPTTGTYKLKSIFSNENNVLFPNQFVNIHMLVDTKKDLVIVPAAAIQRGPQGTYVYVVSGGDTVNIRVVTIAQTTGNNIGISSGINPGDVVVIDGQDKLQDGSKVVTSTSPTGGLGRPASGQPATQNGGPFGTQNGAPSGAGSKKPGGTASGGKGQ